LPNAKEAKKESEENKQNIARMITREAKQDVTSAIHSAIIVGQVQTYVKLSMDEEEFKKIFQEFAKKGYRYQIDKHYTDCNVYLIFWN
jgi:hypothetical protein